MEASVPFYCHYVTVFEQPACLPNWVFNVDLLSVIGG